MSTWTRLGAAVGLDRHRLCRPRPDAPIEYVENDAGRAALAAFTAADPNRRWTVREAAEFVGLGGRGPVLAGSASEVADQLESWLDQTGIDGFNLTYAVQPDDLANVVELLVPELQRRGRYPSSYTEGPCAKNCSVKAIDCRKPTPGARSTFSDQIPGIPTFNLWMARARPYSVATSPAPHRPVRFTAWGENNKSRLSMSNHSYFAPHGGTRLKPSC